MSDVRGRRGRPRVVCIVGPTASGKSALAVALAERLGGEIVSADSRQVYRDLDVGTAKPTAEERRRVAHHCLDLVDPGTAFDVARFRAAATAAIAGVQRRGRLPVVVGGTGLYVRALLGGLCEAPGASPALRAMLQGMLARQGAAALHRALGAVDPAAAARIALRDTVRSVRALEVALATGVPLSRWQARHRFSDAPYDAVVIGLARTVAELDARITSRARAMIADGFLDEVRRLRQRGLGPGAAGLAAVGYPQMLAQLEGRLDGEEAFAATVQATRRFAKRQRTWFRRQAGLLWRHPERDESRIAAEVTAFATGDALDA
jgi:tRNA dimethylallyltransferase